MTVSNIYGQKTKYRITLELDVFDDFNPHEIEWPKVFKLEDDEQVESYIEDLSNPRRWGIERGDVYSVLIVKGHTPQVLQTTFNYVH